MPSDPQQSVTRLLTRAAEGDAAALQDLMPLVYGELRSLAEALFRQERRDHTLQPTALVNEAYLRLVDQNIRWESRGQFFFIAAKAMRNILVDHARARGRQKRGGGRGRVSLTVAADQTPITDREIDLLALEEALKQLAALDERKAALVELRFFGGLTSEQAADVLGIARSTAAEDWRMARAWLKRELREDDEEEPGAGESGGGNSGGDET